MKDVLVKAGEKEGAVAANRAAQGEPELLLLVVHGVLHLLGHDHADRAERRKMWAAQEEILNELGVQIKINTA